MHIMMQLMKQQLPLFFLNFPVTLLLLYLIKYTKIDKSKF